MCIGKVAWEGIYPEGIADLGHALLKLNERKSMSADVICFGKFGRKDRNRPWANGRKVIRKRSRYAHIGEPNGFFTIRS